MSVFEARGMLTKAMKDLSNRWQDIRIVWDDVRAEQIEKDVLAPLEADLRQAAGAMDQLAGALSSVRRDCE